MQFICYSCVDVCHLLHVILLLIVVDFQEICQNPFGMETPWPQLHLWMRRRVLRHDAKRLGLQMRSDGSVALKAYSSWHFCSVLFFFSRSGWDVFKQWFEKVVATYCNFPALVSVLRAGPGGIVLLSKPWVWRETCKQRCGKTPKLHVILKYVQRQSNCMPCVSRNNQKRT